MSRHDGRLVFLDVAVAFGTTNLATTGDPVPAVGTPIANRDIVRLDIVNTNTADIIRVYAGMAAASAQLVAIIGPSSRASVPTLVSQGQQLFFKSTIAAVTTGNISVAGYN